VKRCGQKYENYQLSALKKMYRKYDFMILKNKHVVQHMDSILGKLKNQTKMQHGNTILYDFMVSSLN